MKTPDQMARNKPGRKGFAHAVLGFTLLESMIALAITAIGVLGLAKISALSIASTKVSNVRALVAMQASSMAAAMQGNRAYWSAGVAPTVFSASGTTVVDAQTSVLDKVIPDCSTASAPACTSAEMAAYDLNTWADTMNRLVPTYAASFTCTNSAGAQITCVMTITWSEKYVAVNKTTATGSTDQTATQSYTLYVAP